MLPVRGALMGLEFPLIQVGDFGWGNNVQRFLRKNAHRDIRIVGGNHEDYKWLRTQKAYLGDFGILKDAPDIFFIRGAWSIDRQYRMMHGLHLDEDEELTYEQFDKALDLYLEVKPRIVISHTAPAEVACMLTNPAFGGYNHSRTEEALEYMWQSYEPEAWYFGHWHQSKDLLRRRTTFRCLGINEYLDIEV